MEKLPLEIGLPDLFVALLGLLYLFINISLGTLSFNYVQSYTYLTINITNNYVKTRVQLTK